MRIPYLLRVLVVLVFSILLTVPVTAAAEQPFDAQEITITDTRSGSGPCGFAVQRDLEGTIQVAPRIDEAGQLVLTVGKVDLRGRLTNPANGKTVDIRWVQHNSDIGFVANGATIDVMLGLDGRLFRGYDAGHSTLAMDLPSDGAELLVFTPGTRHEDPWAHVCGLLA